MGCDWHRCEEEGQGLVFLRAPDGREERLGQLCSKHAMELFETFELFRTANERRRRRLAPRPLKLEDEDWTPPPAA